VDAVERLAEWYRTATGCLPPGTTVRDAHTHTGRNDPDGVTQTAEELIAALDGAGHASAVVMTSADPAGYDEANERVLAEAAASAGRLVPYMRVDPRTDDPAGRVRRALDAGHRGVKLHPRAEQFSFDHPGVDAVLDVAAERRVPVLVHAGRAMPPLGPVVAHHLDRRQGLTLVLAHCAISDLGWAAAAAATRPGLVFDTAWWNPADLAALFAWVDASQIVYASDTPYGWPPMSATISIRAAVQAGLAGPALSAVFGGNLDRILTGASRNAMGTGIEFRPDAVLQRVSANLHGAVLGAFRGLDVSQPVDLAIRACETSGTPYDEVLDAIRATLQVARETDEPDRRRGRLGLLLAALSAAATPAVPVPEVT
jgi:predicted TIM-barrel fold metal-dependent hydrolase